MLSDKQKGLFNLLGIPHDNEEAMRKHHKMCVELTKCTKNFTVFLEHRLRSKWRRENERSRPMYVGD
jgi:hypothetical protein